VVDWLKAVPGMPIGRFENAGWITLRDEQIAALAKWFRGGMPST
jgi:hypothetical protein